MSTVKVVFVASLFSGFSACASTSNNGGHVVGNPIISESVSTKMKADTAPTCDCASSKDPKVKASCKCATDTSTSTGTKTAPAKVPCKDGSGTCGK